MMVNEAKELPEDIITILKKLRDNLIPCVEIPLRKLAMYTHKRLLEDYKNHKHYAGNIILKQCYFDCYNRQLVYDIRDLEYLPLNRAEDIKFTTLVINQYIEHSITGLIIFTRDFIIFRKDTYDNLDNYFIMSLEEVIMDYENFYYKLKEKLNEAIFESETGEPQ